MRFVIIFLICLMQLLAGNMNAKLLTSSEVSLEYGQPLEIYMVIPQSDGLLSITQNNVIQCKVVVRNARGKILGSLYYNTLEIPVKRGKTYYIYAKAKSKYCDGFDIFIP